MERLPGLLVSIGIAYGSLFLSQFIPSLGATTLAIILGMILGNTFFHHKRYQKGYQFAETNLLSYSIVLLGATLSAQTILELGFSGISFIILQMLLTIGWALYIGRKLGFSQNFSMLMAAGNAVCGSSAIAATTPAIDADEDEKGISITIVNLTGVVLMLVLPILTAKLYGHEVLQTSAMIGGTLQSVGQVVASGAMVNEHVKDVAMLFKIVRVIFLVGVVFLLGYIKQRTPQQNTNEVTQLMAKKKLAVPWYVLGFFIACFLFTVGLIPSHLSHICKVVSNQLEIIALAAIGLRVNFRHLIQQGIMVSLYGLLIGVFQVIVACILIQLIL